MMFVFSLNLKKIISLTICCLFLAALLVLAGYLFGLMTGLNEAQQKKSDSAIQSAMLNTPPSPFPQNPPVVPPISSAGQQVKNEKAAVMPKQPAAPPLSPPIVKAPAVTEIQTAPAPSPQPSEDAAKPAPADQAAVPPPADGGEDSKTPPDDKSPAPPSGDKKEDGQSGQAEGDGPGKVPAFKPEVSASIWKDGYTIQVGSFTHEENAREMIDHILALNYPAYMYLFTDSTGGIWHVVQVGEYDTKDQAAQIADQLKAQDMIALVKPITESIRQKRKAF